MRIVAAVNETAGAVVPAAADTDGWMALRRAVDGFLARRYRAQSFDTTVDTIRIGRVPVWIARPTAAPAGSDTHVLLDFHGGAFFFGGGDVCRLLACESAQNLGVTTWGVDYRLAPEHPYPAAIDDGYAVYEALLGGYPPRRIFVSGTSAGGNIAAAVLVRAAEAGLPMPAGLLLRSPGIDLTESGDTFRTLDGLDMVHPMPEMNRIYAGGHPLEEPELSPLFADLSGFPPTFLQSGTRDLFLSNTVRFHRRLRAADVEADLHIWDGMPHGGFPGSPEDDEVVAEERRFLLSHLG
jgi:acetyl esterase/lipase